jgi:hypothetical protein
MSRVSIGAKGGIEVAVAALNAHRSSENVQRYGCWALNYITWSDVNVQRRAKDAAGLIDALQAARGRFPAAADHAAAVLARFSAI